MRPVSRSADRSSRFDSPVMAFLPTLQTPGFARHSQFHLVHVRRTSAAARLGARSARRRDAGDDHVRRPVDFRLQRRLHGRRQKFHPLLRLSLVFLRRDARRRHREQPAAALHLLGTGRARVVSADRILDRQPSAAAAAKKAFITTRIGDMGFFLGILWLYSRSGTLLFYDGGNGCLESAGLSRLARAPRSSRC